MVPTFKIGGNRRFFGVCTANFVRCRGGARAIPVPVISHIPVPDVAYLTCLGYPRYVRNPVPVPLQGRMEGIGARVAAESTTGGRMLKNKRNKLTIYLAKTQQLRPSAEHLCRCMCWLSLGYHTYVSAPLACLCGAAPPLRIYFSIVYSFVFPLFFLLGKQENGWPNQDGRAPHGFARELRTGTGNKWPAESGG